MQEITLPAGTLGRILIADNQLLLAEALARILEATGKFVTSIVGDFATALDQLALETTDILLISIKLPGFLGIGSLEQALAARKEAKVVLIGSAIEPPLAKAALAAGVHGIVEKDMPIDALSSALDLIRSGQVFATVRIPPAGSRIPAQSDLTEVELSVLRKTAEGMTNKEISDNLVLPETTIKMHLRAINRKLGSRNRAHAVTVGRELGLI